MRQFITFLITIYIFFVASAALGAEDALYVDIYIKDHKFSPSVIELPQGRKAIGCKWVLKEKKGPSGKTYRYKARLVAKGYTQRYGVDFDETHAPVVKQQTLKLLLTIAAVQNLTVKQADVKTAYLQAKLDDNEIYMECPEGYRITNKVLELRRALYGLKQAGRQWYKTFQDGLNGLGYFRCEHDWSVFTRIKDEKMELLAVYVDDLLYFAATEEQVNQMEDEIRAIFETTEKHDVNWLLGIAVERKSDGFHLSQFAYIDAMLNRFEITGNETSSTPMDPVNKLTFSNDDSKTDKPYSEAVGALIYLALTTRPDIAFAVSVVGRYAANPKEVHWSAIERIFKYLKRTRNLEMVLGGDSMDLVGYTDADWAGDLDQRKSTSGYLFTFAGSVISWKSRKQPAIALSSMEAEYIALSEACKELVWIHGLCKELHINLGVTKMYEDNQACIALTNKTSHHSKAKHIDLRYHYNREVMSSGIMDLTYIKTSEQKADMLTKALGPEKIWQIMNELKFVKSNPSGSVGDCGLELGSGLGSQAKGVSVIRVSDVKLQDQSESKQAKPPFQD